MQNSGGREARLQSNRGPRRRPSIRSGSPSPFASSRPRSSWGGKTGRECGPSECCGRMSRSGSIRSSDSHLKSGLRWIASSKDPNKWGESGLDATRAGSTILVHSGAGCPPCLSQRPKRPGSSCDGIAGGSGARVRATAPRRSHRGVPTQSNAPRAAARPHGSRRVAAVRVQSTTRFPTRPPSLSARRPSSLRHEIEPWPPT